ncbi:PKD domain-containing protein [Pedobacter cryoconitis]|uniref:PKD repeat protein n=1 Tax=Pedobacter cryoconitis TaxID=188932 RepID=A0A7X0J2Q2_9SPHI|nr:PKD domain-containing protein [Pedobacter cryoconitis]MBB6499808.1 PKD repeat protein [Pedobacter cryoconitis]
MRNTLKVCFALFLNIISFHSNAQITIGMVDGGPYTPGSTIAATFTASSTSCIKIGNSYNLYLVDPAGNELNIGSYSGFYATFVNGIIPTGTLAGAGYKVRVKSTNPAMTPADSAPFIIQAGSPVTAALSSVSQISTNPLTFGSCNSSPNSKFSFTNGSTSANVTATFNNELNPAPVTTLTYSAATTTNLFTADQAHYTIFVKAVMPDGTVGTHAYFLINNLAVTPFTTTNSNTVCYPIGAFEYTVNTTSQGIQANFPGNTYRIDWGDGNANEYTYCDIQTNNSKVQHTYTRSSCGLTYTTGNQTTYNAFGINVGIYSPYCGPIGTPLSTTAKVVGRPINKFNAPPVICVGDPVVFQNQSTTGDNPNANSPGCTQNIAYYTWSVDGTVIAPNEPLSYNPSYTFTTKGPHQILLSSSTNGNCQADDITMNVCVQDPPKPAFTISTPLICLNPGTLTTVNTSVLDNTCSAATPAYTWAVTPSTGVTFSPNSPAPQFKFTQPGIYNITLTVQSGTCAVTSAAQRVVVNTDPTATLSPDVNLCATGNLTFNSAAGPTQTTLSGTSDEIAGTYKWDVTGGPFSFVAPDNQNTKYPTINFTDYATYTITLTHQNNCNTVVKTQKITFSPSPIPKITVDPNPICNQATVNLQGTITNGTYTSFIWSGNGGTFSAPGSLTTTYTPSAAERNAGSTTILLQVNTGLTGNCAQVQTTAVVQILPANTGTNTTQNICSGQKAFYSPVSSVTGSTFSWTAVNTDGLATGYTAAGTGEINQTLTNSSTTANAVVIYTITPKSNGCDGTPFTFTATVTPIPVLTATTAQPVICGNEPAGITLASTITNTQYTWTSTAPAGITGNTNQATPVAVTAINDILLNNSAVQGTVSYTITPVSATGCTGTPVVATVSVGSAITIANAGPAQTLCAQSQTVLSANSPKAGETGQWSVVSGTATVTDPANPASTVTGLTAGQNYILRWMIKGAATCAPTTADLTITDLLPVTNTISNTTPVVCYGQTITVTGSTPTGGDGNYIYLWESSTDNGTTWTAVSGQTAKDLSFKMLANQVFRRTVISNSCTQLSNLIGITAQPPIDNNTIAAAQTICAGLIPNPLTGSTPTGGDGQYSYQWQNSPDNTNWTDISAAVFSGYTPPALNTTTYYRRLVSTQACSGALQNISPAVTITVKPNAKANYTYSTDQGCVPLVLDVKAVPYPDRNDIYTWYADGVQIGTGVNFPGYTIKTSNASVVIKLVTTSSQGCSSDEFSHTFTTVDNVVPAFTQNILQGCGPLTVSFINTSSSLTNATFKWDFGNGTTSSLIMPGPITFQPNPLGRDTTYNVSLTATTTCGKTIITSGVLVKAKPISVFSPDKTVGCSPMKVTFTNTSPGTADTYYYDFGDGTLLTKTDKSSVQHTYTTGAVQNYVVKMVAQNDCGRDESSYTIQVSPNTILPELVVNAPEKQGCAPLKVNFYNNSKGAGSFKYDFGDGSTMVTRTAPEVVTHTFTTAGTFTVTLTASNSCSDTTATETIQVLPQPSIAFSADVTLGCPGLPVQFKNTSTGGVGYLWDFGDGTTSAEFEPKHIFDGSQEFYTVTLQGTNSLGCTNSVSMNQYIHIVPPPVAQFSVSPSTLINIPDYTFQFQDQSTGSPAIWSWDFGDKSSSSLQSPKHTYPDTGTYVVTLKVTNQQGCFTTTFKKVTIVGVPGYLYLPNSFMPGSQTPELRVFKAKGSGIKSWKMSIFNKWGQDLYETTKLDDGSPAEGWDGILNGVPVPQDVYFWKVEVEFINGTEWKGMSYGTSAPKRTGVIHLIR